MKARRKVSGSENTIVLLGAGRMGGALLKGWIASNRFPSIHVVEPVPSKAITTLAIRKNILLSKQLLPGPRVRAIVLALKPQIIKSEPSLLKDMGAASPLIVSIAAGITIDFLRQAVGPRPAIVRTVPNTPGAIGQGITALYAPATTAKADKALALALMAPLGKALWLDDEGALDAVTALSGSGPAYVFLLVETLTQAGIAQGLRPDIAAQLARQTVIGAGALLEADKRFPEELRRDVTSPAGTTEAALKVLMDREGLEALMMRAIDAATKRSRELGRA